MANFTYVTAEVAAKTYVAAGSGIAHAEQHTTSGKPAVRYNSFAQALTNNTWIESDVAGTPA